VSDDQTEIRSYPCPRCSTDIEVGVTQCPRCQVALPPEGLEPPGPYAWIKFLLIVVALSMATWYGLRAYRASQQPKQPPVDMKTVGTDG